MRAGMAAPLAAVLLVLRAACQPPPAGAIALSLYHWNGVPDWWDSDIQRCP